MGFDVLKSVCYIEPGSMYELESTLSYKDIDNSHLSSRSHRPFSLCLNQICMSNGIEVQLFLNRESFSNRQ